jgi:hypothetical protein
VHELELGYCVLCCIKLGYVRVNYRVEFGENRSYNEVFRWKMSLSRELQRQHPLFHVLALFHTVSVSNWVLV